MTSAELEDRFVKAARAQGFICMKISSAPSDRWPDRLVLPPVGEQFLVDFQPEGVSLAKGEHKNQMRAKERGAKIYAVATHEAGEALIEAYSDERLEAQAASR